MRHSVGGEGKECSGLWGVDMRCRGWERRDKGCCVLVGRWSLVYSKVIQYTSTEISDLHYDHLSSYIIKTC